MKMPLDGKRVYFLGKLAASNRKEAVRMVRQASGRIAKTLDSSVQILVVGEGDVLSQDWNLWNDQLDDATREAFEAGSLEIVSEAFFWDQCGAKKSGPLSKDQPKNQPSRALYTLSMLAELSGLPIAAIRRLQRWGLIVPIRQVHRLSYFDFESFIPLRIVRSMLDSGMALPKAADRFRRGSRFLAARPLDVRIDGDDVIFVMEQGSVDQDGQRRFDFGPDYEMSPKPPTELSADPLEVLESVIHPEAMPNDFETLCEAAWSLESVGNLQGAVDLYRAALAAGGSGGNRGQSPQLNFQIAELLYRLGDLTAARERYFMAIELDETFVEARANLGCVLAELGNDELAAAAFRGALKHHPDYAEVHFHLGMLLRRAGLEDEASHHFRVFLELMPDSPWADRIALSVKPSDGGE